MISTVIFDCCFSSANLGYFKPQKEFWQSIEKLLPKHQRAEVLFWDDDLQNVVSAKEFSFQAELYTDFEAFKNRMAEYL